MFSCPKPTMFAALRTQQVAVMSFALTAFIAPMLTGCGSEFEPPAAAVSSEAVRNAGDEVVPVAIPFTLTLATREGESTHGWSMPTETMVVAPDANLTLSSWDCGARGRWVSLHGKGVTFCNLGPDVATADLPQTTSEACAWSSELSIGGNNPGVEIGDNIVIAREDVVVARMTLQDRSVLAEDWYNQPILPYDVMLDIADIASPAPVDAQ